MADNSLHIPDFGCSMVGVVDHIHRSLGWVVVAGATGHRNHHSLGFVVEVVRIVEGHFSPKRLSQEHPITVSHLVVKVVRSLLAVKVGHSLLAVKVGHNLLVVKVVRSLLVVKVDHNLLVIVLVEVAHEFTM